MFSKIICILCLLQGVCLYVCKIDQLRIIDYRYPFFPTAWCSLWEDSVKISHYNYWFLCFSLLFYLFLEAVSLGAFLFIRLSCPYLNIKCLYFMQIIKIIIFLLVLICLVLFNLCLVLNMFLIVNILSNLKYTFGESLPFNW